MPEIESQVFTPPEQAAEATTEVMERKKEINKAETFQQAWDFINRPGAELKYVVAAAKAGKLDLAQKKEYTALARQDKQLILAESLTLSDEEYAAQRNDLDQKYKKYNHKIGFTTLKLIDGLRERMLENDPDVSAVIEQARLKIIQQKIEKVKREIEMLLNPPAGLAEKIPLEKRHYTIEKKRQDLEKLKAEQGTAETKIQTGYPELWEKIKPQETPTPPDDEPTNDDEPEDETEQGEPIPRGPEFLTQEAWQAIYQAGINYLETEKKDPDPKKEKETYGYFFIDPTNPHLAEELKDLAVEQDKIIADLEANLKTETSRTKQRIIENDIALRKKVTSWDNAEGTVRKILGPILENRIQENEALLDEEKKLLKTSLMEYPTEAEARAILEKLKVNEPDRAIAMYARTEAGRPLKVFINKTDKKIYASLSLARDSRLDLRDDTKIVSIIGSRIDAKKLAELKNK